MNPASWESTLLNDLRDLVPAHPGVAVHLAIMLDPWMARIEAHKKTIESRWSMNRSAPYNRVAPDDVIVFKRSGGRLAGFAEVDHASFRGLDPARARQIVREEPRLGVDPGFEDLVAGKAFVSLIWLRRFQPFEAARVASIRVNKRDQRGWVVLRSWGTE